MVLSLHHLHEQASNETEHHDDTGSMKRCRTDTHWQRLYQSLQHERITQAEQNLVAFCEESERREGALKSYISHLETELRSAKQSVTEGETLAEDVNQLQATKEQLQATCNEQHNTMSQQETRLQEMEQHMKCLQQKYETAKDDMIRSTETLQQREKTLECYKTLTAMTFQISHRTMECTITNSDKESTTKFKLTEIGKSNDIKYEPMENVKDVLPKFLQQAIEFPKSDAPSFLQHVLMMRILKM